MFLVGKIIEVIFMRNLFDGIYLIMRNLFDNDLL